MLSSLHIRNYILIDSLDVEFPEGLIIVTGQTGTGKSIILGALNLLSGAKADASMISPGADSCVVEAEFEGLDDPVLGEMLAGGDVEEDEGRLLVRRVVSKSGRSRCFVNDCPVNQAFLQELSSHLIDIHSQHRSLILTDKRFQLSVLDSFASNGELLTKTAQAYTLYLQSGRELESLRELVQSQNADRDYNLARLEELQRAVLRDGELEELEEEHRSLANAEAIRDDLRAALTSLDPQQDLPGVSQSLKDAARSLLRASRYLSRTENLASRLESARLELEDVVDELVSLESSLNFSDLRLQQLEDRLGLLHTLLKKHSCTEVSELIAIRERLSTSIYGTEELEERIALLEGQLKEQEASYLALCAELSERRKAAAPSFAEAIVADLRNLELDRAEFSVDFQSCTPGADGSDRISFLFSNNGTPPVDVSRCASGGELSRIMLSLKAMMARFMGMPTLIFDEIDTGVSGSVADKMGRMICRMGEDMQVFSITHLPQVAAKGSAHYLVSKADNGQGRTVTSMHRIQGEERLYEIARLLSGSEITDAAVANARSLLEGR